MTRYRERREAGEFEPPAEEATTGLDAMTKEELLDYARERGVSPANRDMTKDEIRAGIDAKLAEEGG
jgi:hypothetical protein